MAWCCWDLLWKCLRTCVARYGLLVIWVGINWLVFWSTYRMYKGQPQYFYLRNILGRGLCISRGTGAMLNLSCCVVLLPMCRMLTTMVRRCSSKISRQFTIILLDRAKMCHIVCAYTISFASLAHTIAHILNAINFSNYYNMAYPEVNLAFYPGQDPFTMLLTTLPGITGLFMVIVLLALVITSTKSFRSQHFNGFWYTHHLFALFMILLVIHPLGGVLKEQTNIEQHVPGCMLLANDTSHPVLEVMPEPEGDDVHEPRNATVCQAYPEFQSMETQTWIWVSVALVIYSCDLALRIVKRNRPAQVMAAFQHPGNILELQLSQPKFSCKPCQYVLLQCEDISIFEWHPFSVTSCPDETHNYFSVHIKTLGDWSSKMADLMYLTHDYHPELNSRRRKLTIFVDGPFSSPTTGILRSRIAICIAGGIGITPFISVAHYLIRQGWTKRPERLHLVWVVRNISDLAWAAPILARLIDEAWNNGLPDKLELRLHLTGQQNQKGEGIESCKLPECIKLRISFGRPKWDDLFRFWSGIYHECPVQVFSCGPKQINQAIKRVIFKQRCTKNFVYTHEAFP